ncbi:hypothetical protein [Streptomyces sp. Ru62]|nr:hypothetical protein [Streptomyces sp. Ru62]
MGIVRPAIRGLAALLAVMAFAGALGSERHSADTEVRASSLSSIDWP